MAQDFDFGSLALKIVGEFRRLTLAVKGYWASRGEQARARRGGRRATREVGGSVNALMPLIFNLLGLRLSARFDWFDQCLAATANQFDTPHCVPLSPR
jgi:hypothetical protein